MVSTRLMKYLQAQVQSVQRLSTELWSAGKGPILVSVGAGWFLSLGVRMVYPAVLPYLRSSFGLSLTMAGLLITALWVAYALGQLPGGIFDDKMGSGWTLLVSSGMAALSLGVLVIADSTLLLFGSTIMFGFTTAWYGVARFTILTRNYGDRSGVAIGLTMSAGDLGNTILPPLAGLLALAGTWQLGFAFAIPLFFLVTLGIYTFIPINGRSQERPATENPIQRATIVKIGAAFRSREILAVTVIQTLTYFVYQAFTSFYPTYLIEIKGITPAAATILFGGFFSIGILMKPIVGTVYDIYGLRRSLPFILGAMSGAMILLVIAEGLLGLIAVTALASSILGYGVITLPHLTRSLPPDVTGTGLGSLRTGYMLVGAASPTLVGSFADAGFFDEMFFILGAISFLATLLALSVPEAE